MLRVRGGSVWIRSMTRKAEGLVEGMQRLQGLCVPCVRTVPPHPSRTLEQCVEAETSRILYDRLKMPIAMRTWHTLSPRQEDYFNRSVNTPRPGPNSRHTGIPYLVLPDL